MTYADYLHYLVYYISLVITQKVKNTNVYNQRNQFKYNLNINNKFVILCFLFAQK